MSAYATTDACDAEVTTQCATRCDTINGSTGYGYRLDGPTCESDLDCGGVRGEFGVPYSECCRIDGGPGVCVSQTMGGSLPRLGWSCGDNNAPDLFCS